MSLPLFETKLDHWLKSLAQSFHQITYRMASVALAHLARARRDFDKTRLLSDLSEQPKLTRIRANILGIIEPDCSYSWKVRRSLPRVPEEVFA
jgi:hypothetical protein